MSSQDDISQAQFEAAEAFLSGKMQGAERAAFTERLDSDPRFKADFESVRDALLAAEEAGLREDMNRVHERLAPPSKQGFSWLPVAAVILVLIAGAGWWFFPREAELSTEEALFTQFAEPDPGLPVPMSASAADTYTFYDAMVDYKTEDYPRAAQKWRELSASIQAAGKSERKNDTLTYYIGAAEFNAGRYAEAAAQFEDVMASGSSVFADKARLYLTLSLLKTGEPERINNLEIPEGAAYADTLREIKRQIGQ